MLDLTKNVKHFLFQKSFFCLHFLSSQTFFEVKATTTSQTFFEVKATTTSQAFFEGTTGLRFSNKNYVFVSFPLENLVSLQKYYFCLRKTYLSVGTERDFVFVRKLVSLPFYRFFFFLKRAGKGYQEGIQENCPFSSFFEEKG
jgi:hypothetical protein